MPARPQGVYQDGRGGWYFKVSLGADPLTGKRVQVTKRGFRRLRILPGSADSHEEFGSRRSRLP